MKKQIVSFEIFQTSKIMAIFYFLISIPLVLFTAVTFMLSPVKMPMGMLILMPFLYLIFGFIFTIIATWLYNIAASWVGGVEYTTEEK